MSRRGDNIHKRKDGRWEGRYPRGRKENGKILYGSVYGKNYREVKMKIVAIEKMQPQDMNLRQKNVAFAQVLDLWMVNNRVRLKGGTIHKYQYLIDNHIVPELGNISISELDATQINTFLESKLTEGRLDKAGGLSPSYVRSMMLIINATVSYAVKAELRKPMKTEICKPTIIRKELNILTVEEQIRLEKYLVENFNAISAVIFTALHTGLRIGEICGLSWDNVDLERKVISVKHTIARVNKDLSQKSSLTTLILDTPKTKASLREIPISTTLLPILIRLHKTSQQGFLLTGTDKFMQPRNFEYHYHNALKSCGVCDTNFHTLRHTFATRCVQAGVDVKSLSEILGHGSVSITLNTYVHSSLEMKRAQLEKLGTLPSYLYS